MLRLESSPCSPRSDVVGLVFVLANEGPDRDVSEAERDVVGLVGWEDDAEVDAECGLEDLLRSGRGRLRDSVRESVRARRGQEKVDVEAEGVRAWSCVRRVGEWAGERGGVEVGE